MEECPITEYRISKVYNLGYLLTTYDDLVTMDQKTGEITIIDFTQAMDIQVYVQAYAGSDENDELMWSEDSSYLINVKVT